MEIAIFIAALNGIAAIIFFYKWLNAKKIVLPSLEIERLRQTETDFNESQKKLAAITALHKSLQEQINKVETVRDLVLQEKETERTLRNEAETQRRLAEQENQSLKEKMADWEKVKEQHIEAAKASLIEAGSALSNKLLNDHKRETEEAKKDSEKIIKQTTENLLNVTQTLVAKHGSLEKDVKDASQRSEFIANALLNPSGAGSLGEITLASLLENSGLPKEIYSLQQTLNREDESGNVKKSRPDAVIYLPSNLVIAIDSKSSKFFAELAVNDISEIQRKEVEAQLRTRMNEHVKDLQKRDYYHAVKETRAKERPDAQGETHIRILMFLPTEEALGTLRKIDPSFIERTYQNGVLAVSPTGLMNLLLSYKLEFATYEQDRNAQAIAKEVDKLIKNVATLYRHSNTVGNSLKSALSNYDAFAKSFNATFKVRVREFGRLGVESAKIAKIDLLPRYDLHAHTTHIEGESEEVYEEETPQLRVIEKV